MMRQWFYPNNTTGLTTKDLGVMNRAGRRLEDDGMDITHRVLMDLRMAYKPGMSALDLQKIITDDLAEDEE